MKIATVRLKSASPYAQGRYHETPKLESENHTDYEVRVWREKAHVMDHGPDLGRVYIPPMQFKNCLAEAAKYLGIQIPLKGKSTYTKHFEAGVLVIDPMVLPIQKEELKSITLFVPSDGMRGGSRRVNKTFPIIHDWAGTVSFHILDETITKDVFLKHLDQAGKFVGIGAFRVRNNGLFGRFSVEKLDWK